MTRPTYPKVLNASVLPFLALIILFCLLWSNPSVYGNSLGKEPISNNSINKLKKSLIKKIYINKLISKAQKNNFAHKPTWLRLLHYQKTIWGGYKSEADSQAFFLDKAGKKAPQKELLTTLRLLFQTDFEANKHPLCRFPARTKWLIRELAINKKKLPQVKCPKYQNWKRILNAQGISLVFSSYYMNNPASMFGHTFIKVHRKNSIKKNDLLDYGFDFAARPFSKNPFVYTFSGVTGLFPGYYSMNAYYKKVKEYNDNENRDLWEYKINLSPQELERIVDHIWELGGINFYYYYFDENCSYQILSLIEVTRPGSDLTQKLTIVQPADTLKVAAAIPNFLQKPRYRPSFEKRFESLYHALSASQKRILKELIQNNFGPYESLINKKSDRTFMNKFRQGILDTAIAYFHLQREEAGFTDKQQSIYRKILLARSRIQITTEPEYANLAKRVQDPLFSHGSSQFVFSYDKWLDHRALSVTISPALRSLVDNPTGYSPYSEIKFVTLKGSLVLNRLEKHRANSSFLETKDFYLNDFQFIKITSLSPINFFDHDISWKLKLGVSSISNNYVSINEQNGYAPYLEFGTGLTFDINIFSIFYDLLFFYFVSLENRWHSSFEHKTEIIPKSSAHLLWRFSPQVNILSSWEHSWDVLTGDYLGWLWQTRILWSWRQHLAWYGQYNISSSHWNHPGNRTWQLGIKRYF